MDYLMPGMVMARFLIIEKVFFCFSGFSPPLSPYLSPFSSRLSSLWILYVITLL